MEFRATLNNLSALTNNVIEAPISQNKQKTSFKNTIDSLANSISSAFDSKNYLELMKIAVSIKTKTSMVKNLSISDRERLLSLARFLEKKAKELAVAS